MSILSISGTLLKYIEMSQALVLLGLRLWLAKIFFMAGYVKIQSWDSTIMLFQYEYAVPFLSPTVAAWLATAGELAIPVFLVLGLTTRLNAIALFVLNFIASISYPEISIGGKILHDMWGFGIAALFFFGPGALSVDYFIRKRIEDEDEI